MAYDPAALRPGDVLLMMGGGSLLDRAIRIATVSPFVHAALVGDGCIVEALWRVRRSPLDRYAATGWRYAVAGSTDEQRAAAVAWATGRIGAPYGVRELLEDGARDLLHLPLGARWQPRRYTCSGLVAQAWRQAGVRLTWAILPSPMDLACSPVLSGPRPWS